ncbi:hypothetical protein ABBQ38_013011 [Trebouxia sp. C0009 RCD-2024]
MKAQTSRQQKVLEDSNILQVRLPKQEQREKGCLTWRCSAMMKHIIQTHSRLGSLSSAAHAAQTLQAAKRVLWSSTTCPARQQSQPNSSSWALDPMLCLLLTNAQPLCVLCSGTAVQSQGSQQTKGL